MTTIKVSEFHAHIYYDATTRESAHQLRLDAIAFGGAEVSASSLSDGTRGPHVRPMFGLGIPASRIGDFLAWLMQAHGPHSVLIHPVTNNELLDHTHHATWIGIPQPLDLSVLRKN